MMRFCEAFRLESPGQLLLRRRASAGNNPSVGKLTAFSLAIRQRTAQVAIGRRVGDGLRLASDLDEEYVFTLQLRATSPHGRSSTFLLAIPETMIA